MAWEKKVSQGEAVKAFLVTVEGRVDLEASVSKFRGSALKHLAGQEAQDGLIKDCIASLFDEFKGANLNLSYIKSQTVERMGKKVAEMKDPALFSVLSARVEEVLHENTNRDAAEATEKRAAVEEISGRIYSVRKGPNGGFYRLSDQAPEPTKQ